jgi:hypothetical protein
MQHQWLIAELEGLRDYAALNGLPALAAHLDQARLLALAEIASTEGQDEHHDST